MVNTSLFTPAFADLLRTLRKCVVLCLIPVTTLVTCQKFANSQTVNAKRKANVSEAKVWWWCWTDYQHPENSVINNYWVSDVFAGVPSLNGKYFDDWNLYVFDHYSQRGSGQCFQFADRESASKQLDVYIGMGSTVLTHWIYPANADSSPAAIAASHARVRANSEMLEASDAAAAAAAKRRGQNPPIVPLCGIPGKDRCGLAK